LDPAGRQTERVFALGFWANSALALAKLGVGLLTGSRALVADGWHSLSDILTNGGAWLAHRFARTPPDEDHHYGHGNAEALSSVVLGAVLVAGGLGVIWSSWASEARLTSGPGGWVALGVAAVSIVTNLFLARITRKEGRRARSSGMIALSRDNASDALGGVLVVFGILGSRAQLDWAEAVAAFLIGALIVLMGYRSFSDGMDTLMDRVTDPELRDRIERLAREVEDVREVQMVRIHPLGPAYRVDIEISVDGGLTVEEGHTIAHRVASRIKGSGRGVQDVHVHVNPHHPPQPDQA
jgi:cation diffusion facilitator family transporter